MMILSQDSGVRHVMPWGRGLEVGELKLGCACGSSRWCRASGLLGHLSVAELCIVYCTDSLGPTYPSSVSAA